MDSPTTILAISPSSKVSPFATQRQVAASSSKRIGHDDVLHIAELSLDSFLENIRLRYQNGHYYTYIGEVCVSVNPNRSDVNIYGLDYMQLYYGKHLQDLPPHIFAIAGAAYRQTFEHSQDSCVIITGESGSGKTENTKLLLLFITHVVKMTEQGRKTNTVVQHISLVESILLKSNCILEAFGNAKTGRNLNSSRFAKLIDIGVNRNAKYLFGNFTTSGGCGGLQQEEDFCAVIRSYMLEKSRVIEQQPGERNFHAFYQLLASLDDLGSEHHDILGQLALTNDVSQYKFLSSGGFANETNAMSQQDRDEFGKMVEAMESVGFDEHEKKTVFYILAAILHLGNVDFEAIDEDHNTAGTADDQIRIKANSMESLKHFCRLLSLDLASTPTSLCTRQIRTQSEVVRKMYRPSEAVYGRNALAKALYERLFYFILERINRSIAVNKVASKKSRVQKTISLLDLYGFEVLSGQPNSFEQFLVNYCNEKLHQVFVDVMLNKEQKLYDREGLDWKMVEFKNNLPICQLFDEPHKGIFSLLDEACLVNSDQSATDEMLLEQFNSRFARNAFYRARTLNNSSRGRRLMPQADFAIRHYAGEVQYSVEGFVNKNMDLLYGDYKQLLYSSENDLIKEMWKDGKPMDEHQPGRLPITSALEYRKSMAELITCLTSKRQFFIRCIKPIDEAADEVADNFDSDKVRQQIQYLGLVENARVRKAGFLKRTPYRVFLQRYRMLYRGDGDGFDWKQLKTGNFEQQESSPVQDQRSMFQNLCNQIIADNWSQSLDKQIAFGKTLIFFRNLTIIECLEEKRDQFLEKIVLEIQTYSRSNLAKQRFARLQLAKAILAKFAHLKKAQFLANLTKALVEYEKELQSTCKNTDLLEYNQVFLFQWPNALPPMAKNDRLLVTELPKLTTELNTKLVILKFPVEYWVDKLLRQDAGKIFRDKKADWGETRRRWLGNYLTSAECANRNTFKAFFQKHSATTFSKVHFASYILKTNAHNHESIRAIILTERALYKCNIDDQSFEKWLPLEQLHSVSLTPDTDQLVVLHVEPSAGDSDLVFAFYSVDDGAGKAADSMSSGSKVGEFTALLCQQYQVLTGKTLPVNFSKQITFRFNNNPHSIEVKPSGHQTSEWLANTSTIFSEVFLYNVWKRLRGFYLRLQPNLSAFKIGSTSSTNSSPSTYELLHKRIDFELVSRNSFVLIVNNK